MRWGPGGYRPFSSQTISWSPLLVAGGSVPCQVLPLCKSPVFCHQFSVADHVQGIFLVSRAGRPCVRQDLAVQSSYGHFSDPMSRVFLVKPTQVFCQFPPGCTWPLRAVVSGLPFGSRHYNFGKVTVVLINIPHQ